jgi:hypothetical protein
LWAPSADRVDLTRGLPGFFPTEPTEFDCISILRAFALVLDLSGRDVADELRSIDRVAQTFLAGFGPAATMA